MLGLILVLGALVGIYYLLFRGGKSTKTKPGKDKTKKRAKSKKKTGTARSIDVGTWAFAGIAAKLGSLAVYDSTNASLDLMFFVVVLVAIGHVFSPRKVEAATVGVLLFVLVGQLFRGEVDVSYGSALLLWEMIVLGLYVVLVIGKWLFGPKLPRAVAGEVGASSIAAITVGFGALVALGIDFLDPVWQAGVERMFSTGVWTVFFFLAGLAFAVMMAATPAFTSKVLGLSLIASELFLRVGVLAIPGAATEVENLESVMAIVLLLLFMLMRALAGSLLGRFVSSPMS